MRKLFAGALTIAIAAGLLIPLKVNIARAQSGQVDRSDPNLSSVTLSPAVTKPTLDSGQVISKELTVFNDGNEGYTFLVSAGPFSVKDEKYDPDYTTVNASNEAYRWVQFSKTSYFLKPWQSVKVPYTVTVPSNAAPGGHYAVLFAETQPPKPNDGSVARKKRVGSLVYMTVNGDIQLKGKVESWSAQLWQKDSPLTSDVRISNSGNTHFQTDINVVYKDLFNRDKFTLNQPTLILPGTTRRIPINWQNPPAFGIFKVSGQVKMLDKTEQLPQKYVVYTPYWLIYAALGLVAVALVLIVTKKVRKSKHNAKRTQPKKD